MKSKKYQKSICSLAIATALVASGCGKEDESSSTTSTKLTSVSLAGLPSASSMVKSTTSAVDLNEFQNSSMAVTGTAPLLTGLSSTDVDTVFYNGLLATINTSTTWNAKSASQKREIMSQFWGGSGSGPGGSGACRMAQSVGESLSRMLRSAASACYMKGMTKAKTGVTVTSGTLEQAKAFDQTDADKLVKVVVSGDGSRGGEGMDVFIKVHGKNSVGATKYKTELFFCQGSTVTGRETIEVDLETGKMTSNNTNSESGYKGQETVVAYLKAKADGSGFDFDETAERTATVISSHDSGIFKGDLAIKGGTITGKRYFNSTSWGTDKNYSVTNFTGTGLSSLRFTDGAYKGESSWTYNGQSSTHSYTGATEWQNSYYAATQNSQLYTDIQSYSFGTDTFFTTIAAPTVDFSDLSCAVTPDATITFNMSDPGAKVEIAKCEEDRYDNYDLCYADAVKNAENVLRADSSVWQ